jgi:hypothetical protein
MSQSSERNSTERNTTHTIPESNIGYKMLASMGWKSGEGLGIEKQGRREPVATCIKRDRAGLGKKKLLMKVTHTEIPLKSKPQAKKLTPADKKLQKQAKQRQTKKETQYARELYSDIPDEYQALFQ